MAKRAKINNEDPRLSFRIPQEMHDMILFNVNREKTTVSAYLRKLLEKELNTNQDEIIIEPSKERRVMGTLDFLKLVVWLYKKKQKNDKTECPEELDFYISVIKKLEDHLPKGMIVEFDKVLANLLHVKRNDYVSSFKFIGYNSDFGEFDYKKLETYLLEEIG